MKQYEVSIENRTPCGGAKYALREFADVECEDPVAWVRAAARFPVLSTETDADGSVVVTAGNAVGYRTIYTFTEDTASGHLG